MRLGGGRYSMHRLLDTQQPTIKYTLTEWEISMLVRNKSGVEASL